MTLALLKAINAKLRQEKPKAGFTLLELLVVMVMSTLVISSLLALTNQLTQANQREIVRTSTQEEMKRALNYMARELRQAVYVYNGTELTAITDNIPAALSTNGNTPILAFWKAEPVPYTDTQAIPACFDNADPPNGQMQNPTQQSDCNDLQIERRSYTLVVYAQSTANNNNTWEGESRIIRYQLRKFNNDDLTASSTQLRRNTGYVDPVKDNTTFADWPNDEDDANLQVPRPPNSPNGYPVIVDYVASVNNGDVDPCPGLTNTELSQEERDRELSYTRTPFNDTNAATNASFYACVLSAVDDEENSNNQDVVLFLRGSTEGRSGLNYDKFLPLLQTRVILRGVINKDTN